MGESSNLRIAIWRPYNPRQTMLIIPKKRTEGVKPAGDHLSSESAGFQQEIFSWKMQEDAVGGIADRDQRDKLVEILFDKLNVDVEPESRSLAVLNEFIAAAQERIDAGQAEWTDSQSLSPDDENVQRINPLLALKNHLEWLQRVFSEQPKISVTVR